MADTSRTQSDLLTNLFQDGQADGSITAQDMRDLIVSLTPSSATGRFTSNVVFTIGTADTWTGASSGTSEIINGTSDIDMPQDGRIRYTGSIARYFSVMISLSAIVGGNNQDLEFRITLNGTGRPESVMQRSWNTGTDEGSLTLIDGFVMNQNDYIELEAKNDTSTNDITVVNAAIVLNGHLI